MPKTKTQSNDQRPSAVQSTRGGRRPTTSKASGGAARPTPSATSEKATRRVKGPRSERAVAAAVPAGTSTPLRQPRSTSKQAAIITLLRRPEGTDLATLMAATGWQSHSVRAALSGLRKHGHQLRRDAGPNGSVYRIMEQADGSEG